MIRRCFIVYHRWKSIRFASYELIKFIWCARHIIRYGCIMWFVNFHLIIEQIFCCIVKSKLIVSFDIVTLFTRYTRNVGREYLRAREREESVDWLNRNWQRKCTLTARAHTHTLTRHMFNLINWICLRWNLRLFINNSHSTHPVCVCVCMVVRFRSPPPQQQ